MTKHIMIFFLPFMFISGCLAVDQYGNITVVKSSNKNSQKNRTISNGDSGLTGSLAKTKTEPKLVNNNNPPLRQNLMNKLLGAAKTDVAIIPTEKGLIAVGADGIFKKKIRSGKILWATVDNKSGVIWYINKYGKTATLYYLDILKNSYPVAMIRNYPMEGAKFIESSPLSFRVKYKDGYVTTVEDERYLAVVELDFTAIIPKFVLKRGAEADMEGSDIESVKARWKKVKFLHQNKLVFLDQRQKRRKISKSWKKPPKPKKADVDPSDCGTDKIDQSLCGELTPIPYTNLYIVVIGKDCGDMCHVDKALYDPKTKKFINPKDFTKSSSDYDKYKNNQGFKSGIVSPSGKAILSGGTIMNFKKGNVYTGRLSSGGWLGGGLFVE